VLCVPVFDRDDDFYPMGQKLGRSRRSEWHGRGSHASWQRSPHRELAVITRAVVIDAVGVGQSAFDLVTGARYKGSGPPQSVPGLPWSDEHDAVVGGVFDLEEANELGGERGPVRNGATE
jgi:hypothetical protein